MANVELPNAASAHRVTDCLYREIGGEVSLRMGQAGDRLGIAVKTVGEYCTNGKRITARGVPGVLTRVFLRRVKIGRNFWIRLRDLESFLEECRAVEFGAARQAARQQNQVTA